MTRTGWNWSIVAVAAALLGAGTVAAETRDLSVGQGGTLELRLEAGGTVEVTGGGSGVTVSYDVSGKNSADCRVELEERANGLTVITRCVGDERGGRSPSIRLELRVPERFDVELDSMGGGLTLVGLEGESRGKTMGGPLTLRDVRGRAELKTMGGPIELTDSDLDGRLETMGGEVRFENVVGDVRGSSMGGNVRYRNVVRRGGDVGAPDRVGGEDEATAETVQISTMGGRIEIDEAPEGADLHTMGGDIRVTDAERFVRAKTMGRDIRIDAVDGWVRATTMSGDVRVVVVGSGGDVELTSMSGDVELVVPAGFSMELDLELAYTRGEGDDYRIVTDFDLPELRTREWDYDHGSPRKYVRASGSVGGGGNSVKIRTVNGGITVRGGD